MSGWSAVDWPQHPPLAMTDICRTGRKINSGPSPNLVLFGHSSIDPSHPPWVTKVFLEWLISLFFHRMFQEVVGTHGGLALSSGAEG